MKINKVTLKSGSVRYRFVIDMSRPGAPRDQRTITCDSMAEARAERARIESERKRGTLVKPDRVLLGDLCRAWLDARKPEIKPSTYQGYLTALRPFTDPQGVLHSLRAQDLTRDDLVRLRDDMLSGRARLIGGDEPLSARTVNYTLGAISSVLKDAEGQRLVHFNAGKLTPRAKPDAATARRAKERGQWQAAEVAAFLVHVEADRLYAAWLLSMHGLRRGEVLGLRWSDVDLTGERAEERGFPAGTPTLAIESNRVQVAGKTHVGSPKSRASVRTLPLLPGMVRALRSLSATQAAEKLMSGAGYNPHGLVVVHADGEPIKPENYSDLFTRHVTRAGLPRIPLHGARHAAATKLANSGVALVLVSAWLGQSQMSVTARYQHPDKAQLTEAAEKLAV